MRRRKRRKNNPSDPAVTYWLLLGGVVVAGVAVWAWKSMKPSDQAKALPGLGAVPNLPPTRESCLECVDKHLGAALVLITETRDGYAHRLRAIGHLHEAEDESQEWPQLHNAIRDARKRYQQTGQAPDFNYLEAISMQLRGVRRQAA